MTLMLLTACGGGGGDDGSGGTDPVDKFLGTWAVCIPFSTPAGQASARTALTISGKTSATRVTFATTVTAFPNASCSGPVSSPAVAVNELSGTVVIDAVGTGPAGADKLTLTLASGATEKDIALRSGNQLQFGNTSPVDAQGYPTTLATDLIFTRQ